MTLTTIDGSAAAGDDKLASPPRAPARPVETTYFGTNVTDPYRWMEDTGSPEVAAWLEAQGDHTRAMLDSLPWHREIAQRVNELAGRATDVKSVLQLGGRIYYLKRAAGEDRYKLLVRDGDGEERLLVDPAALKPDDHAHMSIDYYAPSPDGRYVAFGASPNGSENSVISVLDVAGNRLLPERIDRARGGYPQWRDATSFFYTRLPALPPGAPPSQTLLKIRCYLHAIGNDPAKDQPVLGHGVSPRVSLVPVDIPFVVAPQGSSWALGVVTAGAETERRIYVAPAARVNGADTPWRLLAGASDGVTDFAVHGNDVYLLTHKDAPRSKVIRTRLDAPDLRQAETVVAPSQAVGQELFGAEDAVYVRLLDAGVGRLLRIPFDSTPVRALALPFAGAIDQTSANTGASGVLFRLQTWNRAPTIYRYDATAGQVADTHLLPPSAIDTSAYESVEVQATSADGVAVPLSIVYRKGLALDGSHPTWLSGYGSYGASQDPSFQPRRLAWLERGGVFAMAHVRGGGEYGEEWHVAGMKQHKQKTIDDFIACARYLIAHKYTSPAHLAGEGTSAGGITIGGAITQHPELFAAAIIRVGFSDAVRIEETPIGPANALEFGSSSVATEFAWLYAMSPYHHVRDGVAYPAVLLTGADSDARVPLWQPAKMTARLQAATASGKPVLLRVAHAAGHGGSSGTAGSQLSAELADCYTFLYWQLRQPGAASHTR
jgi:prolyl oligopeptidase